METINRQTDQVGLDERHNICSYKNEKAAKNGDPIPVEVRA